jgi:L-malate glycosyltransferase
VSGEVEEPGIKVLHLCADYVHAAIYRELLAHFAPGGRLSHTVYVPLQRNRAIVTREGARGPADVIVSEDYSWHERFLYGMKARKITEAVKRQVRLADVRVIHAHTLFSMGGVGLSLKEENGIPYIVAVRNTDLNYFFRLAAHLRRQGLRILSLAERIVFLSSAYQDRLLRDYVPRQLWEGILEKSVILPNGVADFWLENRWKRAPRGEKEVLELLFVGEFTRNRNVPTAIEAVRLLNEQGVPAHLSVVGAGPEADRIARLVRNSNGAVTMYGWANRDLLLKHYRNADVLVMPSFHDTFGLVYVEAMTQGIPIIGTKGEGIDGYFPSGQVGFACNPRDPKEIASRIQEVGARYDEMSRAASDASGEFSWSRIAVKYEHLYREAAGGTIPHEAPPGPQP